MVIAKFGEVKITFTDLMQPLAGIEGDIRDHEVTHCSLNQSFALVETKGLKGSLDRKNHTSCT